MTKQDELRYANKGFRLYNSSEYYDVSTSFYRGETNRIQGQSWTFGHC